MTFDLSGRVAVVTGGTGVLGGALARGLAQAGVKVGVLGRRTAKAEEVAAQIRDRGGEAHALPADVPVNAAGGSRPGAAVVGELSFST